MIVYSNSVKNFCDNISSIPETLNKKFKEVNIMAGLKSRKK